MKFQDIKLSTKQRSAFTILLILLSAISIYQLRTVDKIKTEMEQVTGNWLPRALTIADLNLTTSNLRLNHLHYAFSTEAHVKEAQKNTIIALISQIEQNLDLYDSLKTESVALNLYSEQEQVLFDQFVEKWESYQDSSIRSITLSLDGKFDAANQVLLNAGTNQLYEDFSEKLVELVRINKKESSEATRRAQTVSEAAHSVTIAFLVTTIVLFVISVLLLGRYVIKPIKLLDEAAQSVAAGNLEVRLPIHGKDEIGTLAASFNKMTQSLADEKKKTERQARKLREQHEQVQVAYGELEYKNADLQRALRQLKSAQEQLLLKEKMASLGDLVAGLAHEINNPIGTITASTDVSRRCVTKVEAMLADRSAAKSTNGAMQKTLDILKENIQVILDAGNRIATLVKSLKNFSRLDESGYKVVDIHEGLESTLTILRNEWQERIAIEKKYGDLPKLPCYPGQLNQVFLNILKNAISAIDGNGTIRLTTSMAGDMAKIDIIDSGHGIPEEKQKKLFSFGFSESEARIKLSSGLTTAYNIIRQHKGEIKVKSKVGKGTTVSILLPKSADQSISKAM